MRLILFFALVLPAFGTSHAVNAGPEYPNYVVIGAFASRDNAVRFTRDAVAHEFDAHFDINPNRNLYYVFVMVTGDRPAAIREATRLRKETSYFDAWVYQGVIGQVAAEAGESSQDIDPVTQGAMTVTEHASLVETQAVPVETNEETLPLPDSAVETAPPANRPALDAVSRADTEERNFIFAVKRGVDNTVVDADVDMVDPERSRKIRSYKANESVKVDVPSSLTKVSFVCELMGYRKVQKTIDFNAPIGDGIISDGEGNIIVPFELVRLQKGDIAVMYNVFFYKDAAIMRPESRYEVNRLLEMLNENSNYRIKLHGHTNGNARGKIITMGESKNFFSLTGAREGSGSAKKLSEERANAIREYLMDNGIGEDRIEIKAWGGKRPLHDKNSARAQENVRVEVEILNL